MSCHWIN